MTEPFDSYDEFDECVKPKAVEPAKKIEEVPVPEVIEEVKPEPKKTRGRTKQSKAVVKEPVSMEEVSIEDIEPLSEE